MPDSTRRFALRFATVAIDLAQAFASSSVAVHAFRTERTMKRRFAVALQLTLFVCFSEKALSAVLFGEFGEQNTPLFSVNQSTGKLTRIGPTGFSNVADLTSDPATGRLWGVEAKADQPGRLLSINVSTGAAAVVATLDSAKPIVSLAFDPIARKLYGSTAVGFGAARDALYAIDPLNGH